MNSDIQTITSRLPIILAVLFALGLALLIGSAVGSGDFLRVYLLLFVLAGAGVILALGPRYWLLIPVAFSFDLPAIPFGGRAFEFPEVAIVLCTVVCVFRYALSARGFTVFRSSHLAVLLYTAWAGLIFALHPVGLLVMGSSSGGARFYFKIALACLSFLIVANQKLGEREIKWLIRILVIGSVVTMIIGIVRFKISPASISDSDEDYYSWHQALSVPAMWITLWLVSRYRLKDLLGLAKPRAFFLFMLCIVVAAVSGKRAGLASVLLFPLIAAALRKEYFYIFVGAVGAAVMIAVLTFGQGELFRLPLQVQRSLSYLPGKWDSEIRGQFDTGLDPFRKELRQLAWEKVELHPFVGEGYAMNLNEAFEIRRTEANMNEFGIRLMALGSQWHNTWLGIWADFGLPEVIFWAFFWIQALVIGYQVYRKTLEGSPAHTLSIMLLVYFIADVLRSWTSGHSALDPFTRWWMYGILLSLFVDLKPKIPEEEKLSVAVAGRGNFEAIRFAEARGTRQN